MSLGWRLTRVPISEPTLIPNRPLVGLARGYTDTKGYPGTGSFAVPTSEGRPVGFTARGSCRGLQGPSGYRMLSPAQHGNQHTFEEHVE
jgi:hypothetical protein